MLMGFLSGQIRASYPTRLISCSCRAGALYRKPKKAAAAGYKLNPEQKIIVEYAKDYNLCVPAVPGSGKTTVAVEIMKSNPPGKTLVVTYSKLLQVETVEKARKCGLGRRHISIFTIHGLAGKLAGKTISDDEKLRLFLKHVHLHPFAPKFGLDFEQIIVDEAQDLKLLYYGFVLALYRMVKEKTGVFPRLVVMGDSRQAIYDYNGGDSRYLTLADTIFKGVSPYRWKRIGMTQSHRFGAPSAKFVNVQSNSDTVIRGSEARSQNRPIFMVVDDIWNVSKLSWALIGMISQYKPQNTAILAPTQRPGTPLAELVNELAESYGIPIAGLPDDDAELTTKTMKGKLVMSTYHKFKGRERDLVIVLGADGNWFHHYGLSHPEDALSNEHFVAFTRHKEQLVIIHENGQPLLPTLDKDILHSTCEIVKLDDTPMNTPQYEKRDPKIQLRVPEDGESVKGLLKHLSGEEVLNAAERYLQIRTLKATLSNNELIEIPSEVSIPKGGKIVHYEPVSDLTGVAITAAFEYKVTGGCRTLMPNESSTIISEEHNNRSIWFEKAALDHYCKFNEFPARRLQLPDQYCTWLQGKLDKTNQRLHEYIKDTTELAFEQSVKGSIEVDGKVLALFGVADVIQGKAHPIIHEIKFTVSLTTEDIMQVALYGYLWARQNNSNELPELRLFNVRTGEVIEVESTLEKVESLIRDIARWKYSPKSKLSDDNFIAMCDDEVKRMANVTLCPTDSDSV